MNKMKIYLAGPISGMSYQEVVDRIQDYYIKLDNYEVLSPMTGKEELRTEKKLKAHGYDNNPIATNHAIVERDRWSVSRCDVLLADLIGTVDISIGTVMELAWASMLGKHTVVIMEKDNVHQHAFILEAADIVFDNKSDAINYLHKLSR